MYSVFYREPNFPNAGRALISTDIITSSSEELDKFNTICKKVLESLNNLVSTFRTEVCIINKGKSSNLTFSIYLGGNLGQNDGKHELRAMTNDVIFETSKKIIRKEIKELKEVSETEIKKTFEKEFKKKWDIPSTSIDKPC